MASMLSREAVLTMLLVDLLRKDERPPLEVISEVFEDGRRNSMKFRNAVHTLEEAGLLRFGLGETEDDPMEFRWTF